MNEYILAKEVQDFILEHREQDASIIALRKSPFAKIEARELASQIDSWQRCVKKLPTWAYHHNIYYPPKVHIEQSSSEHTALVKQTLIHKDAKVIDLTGGMGVDSSYLAQGAKYVIHCEINEGLSKIAAYNAEVLGVNNLYCKNVDGVEYLKLQPDHYFDYIYIDPSRRQGAGRVFLLQDCVPNILDLQSLFFAKAKYVITKLSPLLDIHAVLKELNWVESVYVISLDNDCKELLIIQNKNYIGIPKIRCIRLYKEFVQDFIFTYPQEEVSVSHYSPPLKWLYDPDVSITKAGAFKAIGTTYNLFKLAQHSHLYTSNDYVKEFPGKIFKILNIQNFSSFKKNKSIKKANVISKNFPTKVEEIRKRFKIADGGELFCYFTSDSNGKQIVISCQRIY